MRPKPPVVFVDLFSEERSRLIEVLDSLSEAQRQLPASWPGWTVKDIAAHVLGNDLNILRSAHMVVRVTRERP